MLIICNVTEIKNQICKTSNKDFTKWGIFKRLDLKLL